MRILFGAGRGTSGFLEFVSCLEVGIFSFLQLQGKTVKVDIFSFKFPLNSSFVGPSYRGLPGTPAFPNPACLCSSGTVCLPQPRCFGLY